MNTSKAGGCQSHEVEVKFAGDFYVLNGQLPVFVYSAPDNHLCVSRMNFRATGTIEWVFAVASSLEPICVYGSSTDETFTSRFDYFLIAQGLTTSAFRLIGA